jgi:dihydrofolate reductase
MANPDPLRLSLIAAVAENRVIGRDGVMPWQLSTDLRRFKSITMGKPVIMGRKTFLTQPRPLPQTVKVVLSRNPSFFANGAVVVPTVESAISASIAAAAASDVVEAVVIGGGEIYREFMPRITRLYLTQVDMRPIGDTWFPDFDLEGWRIAQVEEAVAGDAGAPASSYAVYERD